MLYKKALEFVRLGDASVDAYEKLDSLFDSNLVMMAPFDQMRDGLGLEDRPVGEPDVVDADLLLIEDGGIVDEEVNQLQ